MENIFGHTGERSGKANEGERLWRAGGAESEQIAKQEALLRSEILRLDENIRSIAASIDSLADKMEQGKKIADEKGDERLSVLNARLEEEAQKEKTFLAGEKDRLETEKKKLQTELGNLSI